MPYEVILKQPVYGLGAEADLVKVKAGYARNYLIPRDLAVPATEASKKIIETLQKKRAEREAQELNDAQEKATALNKVTVTFQMETNESGKLFGAVTAQDIAERLETMGQTVDRKKIVLSKPLKEVGEHSVGIHLGAGVQAKITVVLESNQPAEAAEEAGDKKAKKKPAKTEA